MNGVGFGPREMSQIVPQHVVWHNLCLASLAVGQMVETIGTAAHFGNGSNVVFAFLDDW